jgi:hypothetical protein
LSLERTILPIWDVGVTLAEFKLMAKARRFPKLDFSEVAEKDEESPVPFIYPRTSVSAEYLEMRFV